MFSWSLWKLVRSLPVCMCGHLGIPFSIQILWVSVYAVASVHAHAGAITLRSRTINLCLTCLFTELLCTPSGVCAALNAANKSSNEKMQMISLDPAPNPQGPLTLTPTRTHKLPPSLAFSPSIFFPSLFPATGRSRMNISRGQKNACSK